MKTKIKCIKCDKEFEIFQFKIKNNGNLCFSCKCKENWAKRIGNKPRQTSRVKIKCMDCGKEITIYYFTVKSEGNRCVSCSNKNNAKKENRYKPHTNETKEKISLNSGRKLPYGESSFNTVILHTKNSAKKRGLSYSLTRDEFRKITSSNCNYCGCPPSNECKSKSKIENGSYIYNGIDRIDTKIGYEFSNCVPCCKICNWAKGTLNIKDFEEWIKRLTNFQLGIKP